MEVKGSSRVFWANKANVAAFASSEIPIDVRVCLYAASKTLLPHLELLQRDLPTVVDPLRYVLADDAHRGNEAAVGARAVAGSGRRCAAWFLRASRACPRERSPG